MFKKLNLIKYVTKATLLYEEKVKATNYMDSLAAKFKIDECEEEIIDLFFKGVFTSNEVEKLKIILEKGTLDK